MVVLLLIAMAVTVGGISHASAADRIALVLAAEDYQKLPKSVVGTKRATGIADALKALGFEVVVAANPTNSGARAQLRDFSGLAANADVALVVFAGHTTSAGGQSFLLPVNAEIGAATDLLSRGISVGSVAQIVGRAKAGGVFILMTTPRFPTPVEGINARPEFGGEIPKNVVAVFSSSSKVPVSNVDVVSEQSADALAKALQIGEPTLADAVSATSHEVGVVFGTPSQVSLAKPAEPATTTAGNTDGNTAIDDAAAAGEAQKAAEARAAEAQKAAETAKAVEEQKTAEVAAQLDNERQAREEAEKRSKEDQAKAESAQAEMRKAQADVARAQADAKKAQADAERAVADAEKAKAEARQMEAQAELAKAQAEAARAAEVALASKRPSNPIDESQLGDRQRQQIQVRLREMGLYTGAIDAIMGPLTREAIMGFQRSRGATVTGYLTPEQYQELVPGEN
jgi:hypothetical protein